MNKKRGAIDSTLAAMFSNQTYSSDYLFYAHMIGQCSIIIDKTLPAPAGVAFQHDHFNLYINPDGVDVELDKVKEKLEESGDFDPKLVFEKDGVKFYKYIIGYDQFTLVERLVILKHEMLHILYDHVGRQLDRIHDIWNIAADCALNQQCDINHLPDTAILPHRMEEKLGFTVPVNKSAEFYYELIKKNAKDASGQSSEQIEKAISDLVKDLMDSHDSWNDSVGDKELKADLTKKMIESAQNETLKTQGKIPNECGEWMKLHTRKSEVNWRTVLRKIVGHKKVGRRSTIMKKNRRFPGRPDLRGTTKDRTFNLLIVADVSGSMSNKAITTTVQEVQNICELTNSSIDLIQIDTKAHLPEKLSKDTKFLTRKSSGGTQLYPAIEMADKHRLDYQAVVVLTDGYLFNDEVAQFASLRKRLIWLIEPSGTIMPEMNNKPMQAFKLKA